jgi:hypothetical protein
MKQFKKEVITYDDLLQLWDEMTILPDHLSLRMIPYTDGTYALYRAKDTGFGLGDEVDLLLTEPMTNEQMYKHLQNLWLQALKEE